MMTAILPVLDDFDRLKKCRIPGKTEDPVLEGLLLVYHSSTASQEQGSRGHGPYW